MKKVLLQMNIKMGEMSESEMDILIADTLVTSGLGEVIDSKEYVFNNNDKNIAFVKVEVKLKEPICERTVDNVLMDAMCTNGAEMLDSAPYEEIK